MSDKIMAAITNDFANRMRWWAQLRGDGTGVQSSHPSDGPGGSVAGPRFHKARVPCMLGIVHDTEMAIDALPTGQALAVKLYWLFEGRSLRWHARELRNLLPLRYRQLEHRTIEAWVIKGHEQLKVAFRQASECWHQQVADAEAQLTPKMRAIRMRNLLRDEADFYRSESS